MDKGGIRKRRSLPDTLINSACTTIIIILVLLASDPQKGMQCNARPRVEGNLPRMKGERRSRRSKQRWTSKKCFIGGAIKKEPNEVAFDFVATQTRLLSVQLGCMSCCAIKHPVVVAVNPLLK